MGKNIKLRFVFFTLSTVISLVILLEGRFQLLLQGLLEISGPLRGKGAYRPLPSVYSYASGTDARETDLLPAMHRDIRYLSSIESRQGQL